VGRSLHLPKSEIRELYTLKNPAVKYQRVMAYIGVGLEEAPARLDLEELTSGSSVTLMVPYDERVFSGARVIDGIRTAFPIHAYLDLEGVQGSGEEAANRLGEYRDHIVLIGGWVPGMLIGGPLLPRRQYGCRLGAGSPRRSGRRIPFRAKEGIRVRRLSEARPDQFASRYKKVMTFA